MNWPTSTDCLHVVTVAMSCFLLGTASYARCIRHPRVYEPAATLSRGPARSGVVLLPSECKR